MKDNHFILLTIDVEDWFQVENFKPWIPFHSWSSRDLRVEKNTHRLLDLFDSFISTQNTKPVNQHRELETRNPIKATFFILGWIAEQLPSLVREIHARGHEVASHGYKHNLCTGYTSNDLKTDLIHSKKILEDIIGDRIYGYRAPSFAINNDILRIIQDCGYLYDSSYNSFNLHGRYGKISLNGIKKRGIAVQISKAQNPVSGAFYELPISNAQFGCLVIPWGGGAYFRLAPFRLFFWGLRKTLEKDGAFLFYMHPWEIDPEQPRVTGASASNKFRHYIGLNKTYSKLLKMINRKKDCPFLTCLQYLTRR
jgi:polysaccharide deacetylase family protein (PEP-CTERM system associated)